MIGHSIGESHLKDSANMFDSWRRCTVHHTTAVDRGPGGALLKEARPGKFLGQLSGYRQEFIPVIFPF
jgi:hypothetical protein